MISLPRTAIIALALWTVESMPAECQTSELLNGVGYGTLGMVIGVGATYEDPCGEFLCFPEEEALGAAVGLLAGIVTGGALAYWANWKVSKARPIGLPHLAAVTVGTVGGGGALGLATGGILGGRDGAAIGTLVGAAYGVYHLSRNWTRLTTGEAPAGVTLELAPGAVGGGRPGVIFRARF